MMYNLVLMNFKDSLQIETNEEVQFFILTEYQTCNTLKLFMIIK